MNLDVDICLRQGRFLLDVQFRCFDSALGIFGPSGCGKSTLFRAIAGLVRPDRGSITLDGEPLFDADRHLFVKSHERHIGLVFQDARLFPHWSVEENLRAGECMKKRVAERPYSFEDIVDLLNIGTLIGRSTEQLSGGEKQRIAIGRTLLSNPRLLLMDEPVVGLDVSLKRQILPFLAHVHRTLHIPTILISHDLGEVQQLTDRLLLMREGTIVGNDTLDRLTRDPRALQELRGAHLTNLLKLCVARHDAERGISILVPKDNNGLSIETEYLPDLSVGECVSMGIAGNQIALASRRMEGISMRNQIQSTVHHIIHAPDRSICHLSTPIGPLFVEITPGTEQEMALSEGAAVWALFKSRSIHRL
ncbi:MAG TPA: molybdenum ABC transporter ATP-binding protein [Pontiella sp.]